MNIFQINVFWVTLSPNIYGLMYAISFLVWFLILKKRWFFTKNHLDDIFLYIFLWVVLWWRLWYILFYNLEYYINNPWDIIKFWEWWMSFHGWVLGVIFAMFIFSRKKNINFYKIADQVCAVLPIWLWLWRLWNYANKELLWFADYKWWWAIHINWVDYFPSTLLEAFLEWFILYVILYYIYRYQKFTWQIACVFLIWYWVFRLIVELFFRQPDEHIWYVFSIFSIWSLLTIPMILFWVFFYVYLSKKKY